MGQLEELSICQDYIWFAFMIVTEVSVEVGAKEVEVWICVKVI